MIKITRTKKMFTVLAILLVMSLFACQAFAWTISRDFEGGTAGQVATGSSGFFWVNSNNINFSNTVVHNGSKSVAANFVSGSATSTGATFEGNNAYVNEGGECWYRVYYYFPTGWSFASSPASKIHRINTTQHMLSVYAGPSGDIVTSNEPAGVSINPATGQPYGQLSQVSTGVFFDIGKWQSIELYVKLSHVPGQAIYRIWKNGILTYEDKTMPTLMTANDRIEDRFTLFNYWNGGAPKNETAYIDDIKITSDTPSNVDAHGNHMIGPTDWQGGKTALPLPLPAPTGLKVT